MAAEYLDLELLTLQASSDILKTIPRKTLTLVAGTYEYTMPSDTLDVKTGINGEAGTIVDSAGKESQVFAISRAEYMAITNKTASGRPTRAYLEKADTIKVYLWPAPDSTCVSWNYAQVRIITEPANGAATVDLRRTWWKAVMLGVAAEVARAKGQPLELAASLRSDAEAEYLKLRQYDTQHGPIQCVVSHNVNRWS